MNIYKESQFVLISAYQAEHPEQNYAQRKVLRKALRQNKLGYKLVEGYYKGDHEFMYLVVIPDSRAVTVLRELGTILSQESILWVDEQREAFLVECGDSYKDTHIGKFQRISHSKAKSVDGWTYDISQDQYWSVL